MDNFTLKKRFHTKIDAGDMKFDYEITSDSFEVFLDSALTEKLLDIKVNLN